MFKKSVTKLILTGATGLVGSKFLENYSHKFSISTIGRNNVDINLNLTSKNDVFNVVTSSNSDAVINFAAYTFVDAAEREKGQKTGEVYTLNALLPLWLAKACKKSGKSFYHISTDYVFDGLNDQFPYTEEDLPAPVDSWYAISKYQGEINVANAFEGIDQYAIIRISYPFSASYNRKLDFARVIVDKLTKGENYFGCIDQKIKPTSLDDISQAIDLLISQKSFGIFHVSGKYPNDFVSPYDFAKKVAKVMQLNSALVKPITFMELSGKRVSPRPRHTWLNTSKIENLGMRFSTIDEVLKKFKKQFLAKY